MSRPIDSMTDRCLAAFDVKERTTCEKQGLRAARFRHKDTWLWFAFKADSDPKALASTIAAKYQALIDELVVL